MPIRPWYEVERLLREQNASLDEIFATKNRYFDYVMSDTGLSPEDEEIEKRRKMFLFGNEREWELLKAAKSGLIRGFAEVPETGADIIEFGQRIFPGDSENINAVEENLRGMAEDVREQAGPFQPSSFQERVAAGVSMAPGIAISMLPVTQAVGAVATPALAAAGLGTTAAPIAAGAIGFGAYEAIRRAREPWSEVGKGAAKGAALGTILGAASRLTSGVGKGLGGGLKSKAAGHLAGGAAAGAGTGAFELATGATPEQAAETAAVFGLMSAAHRNKYNKIADSLNKAGVNDPKVVDATFELTNEIETAQYAEMARKRKAKKRGETVVPTESEQPSIKVSELATELNVDPSDITGVANWAQRFKRVSNEQPSQDDIKLEMWKKLQVLNMQKKAAREEPGAMETDSSGRILGPTQEYSRYWDAKFQGVIRPLQDLIRKSPEQRIGAVYEVSDSSGQVPIFRIQRIDWKKNSPAQWKVESLVDPEGKPKFFRTLTDAENSLKTALNADPAMTAGDMVNHGLKLSSSNSRMARMIGRSLISIGAKKLGKPEIAEAVMPISIDDAARMSANLFGIPYGQALMNAKGRFGLRGEDITTANLKDAKTFFHELGHWITKAVIKSRLPEPTDKSPGGIRARTELEEKLDLTESRISQLFSPEEMTVLEGQGIKEYTPAGSTTPALVASGSSYAAEGISSYIKMKLYGLEPNAFLTKLFNESDAGRSAAAKIDAWLNGIDPENPANGGRIPGLGDKMSQLANIWDRYRQQNPSQVAESMVSGSRGGLITHPLRELGRAIQQAWFASSKWSEDTQKKIWAVRGFLEIPDERRLDYLRQFNSGSSVGQMGRAWLYTGKIMTPTGSLQTRVLSEVIGRAGFNKVNGAPNQERAINDYVTNLGLVRDIQDLTLILESERANIEWAKLPKEELERRLAGETASSVSRESRLVPGRKIMSVGELLGLQKEKALLEERLQEANVDVDSIKAKIVDPKSVVVVKDRKFNDPVEYLRKIDEVFPNARKEITEFLEELDAVEDIVYSPVLAGGTGVPHFDKNGKEIYKKDDKGALVREAGPSDFHGLDLQEVLRRTILNRRNYRSEADKIRRNPHLKDNMATRVLEGPQMVGGKKIRATDYWGTSKEESPLMQWIMRVENMHASTNFNRLMHEYYEMIHGQGKLGLNIGQIPSSSAVQGAIKSGKLKDIEQEMMVGYRYNGSPAYIQFNPNTPEGIRAFNSVKRDSSLFAGHKLLDIVLGGPKRMMVLGTTGANVGFLLYTNALRDTMTSSIQTRIKERKGIPGFYRTFSDFAPFLVRSNLGLAFRGLETARKRAEARGPEELKRFESFLRYYSSPVKGSALVSEDFRSRGALVSEFLARVNKAASENEKDVQHKMAQRQLYTHIALHPVEALRTLSAISEDLNRFPEFYLTEREMLAEGRNPTMQPVSAGAEVSIDFKRAGMYARVLNDMIPFFNPSLQGMSKFGRVLFNEKEPSLKNINGNAIAFAAQTVTIPSVGLWLLNKDEEWYKELPNWEKLMFWHVKAKDTVLRIPVPFEWGLVFGQLPVMIYDSIYNDAPERIKEQMMIGIRQLVPYGFVDNLPQAIKPAVEAVANKNFFTGIPIESKKMEGLLPQYRYTSTTAGIYKGTAKLAAMLHAPETFQSPVMLEHLVRGYGGSVISGIINDIDKVTSGRGVPLPFSGRGMLLSRMISDTDRPGQSVADFYDKMDTADKAWKTAKGRIEAGDTASAAKILNKYKKFLNLSAQDIRNIIMTKNTSTPNALLDMHRTHMTIAQARKEEENKAMTETAQAILGREWE